MTETAKKLYIVGPTDDDYADPVLALCLQASRTDASAVVVATEEWGGWRVVCPQVRDVPRPEGVNPSLGPDSAVLLNCDALLLLGGWEYSRRARSACIDAARHDMPIYDYLADFVPWHGATIPCLLPIRPVFDARLPQWTDVVESINRHRIARGLGRIGIRYMDPHCQPFETVPDNDGV